MLLHSLNNQSIANCDLDNLLNFKNLPPELLDIRPPMYKMRVVDVPTSCNCGQYRVLETVSPFVWRGIRLSSRALVYTCT